MRTVSTVTVVGFSIKNQTCSISEDDSAEEADLKIRPEERAQMVGYLHISLHCFGAFTQPVIDLLVGHFLAFFHYRYILSVYTVIKYTASVNMSFKIH